MSKPKLDLSEEVLPTPEASILSSQNDYEQRMVEALEAQKGIVLEFDNEDDAIASRFGFYNERDRHRAQGVKLFDILKFGLKTRPDGVVELKITKNILPKGREL